MHAATNGFHCELNPIEYLRGMMKKYLCDHCDYSFDGLKENLPKALNSVTSVISLSGCILGRTGAQLCYGRDAREVHTTVISESAAGLPTQVEVR
jgi:hypothetical protein